MCFQSCDHLFRCLMSSVINKCMALISLCVAGAQELSVEMKRWRPRACLTSSGDADPGMGRWPLSRCSNSLLVQGFHDLLLSSKSIKLLLTELSLASRGAYCISDSGQGQGKTLIFFFFFYSPCNVRSDMKLPTSLKRY